MGEIDGAKRVEGSHARCKTSMARRESKALSRDEKIDGVNAPRVKAIGSARQYSACRPDRPHLRRKGASTAGAEPERIRLSNARCKRGFLMRPTVRHGEVGSAATSRVPP